MDKMELIELLLEFLFEFLFIPLFAFLFAFLFELLFAFCAFLLFEFLSIFVPPKIYLVQCLLSRRQNFLYISLVLFI